MASLHHLQLTDARYTTVNNVAGDQHVHVSDATVNCEYYYVHLLFLTRHLHVVLSSDNHIRRLAIC